jgi:hypothetical protein
LLPGGLQGESWYLGWEILVAWRGVLRRGEANGTTGDCLGLTVLSSMVLAVLLIIGGIEQNPGPVVEVENTVRLKTMTSYTKIITVFSMARQIVEGFLPQVQRNINPYNHCLSSYCSALRSYATFSLTFPVLNLNLSPKTEARHSVRNVG